MTKVLKLKDKTNHLSLIIQNYVKSDLVTVSICRESTPERESCGYAVNLNHKQLADLMSFLENQTESNKRMIQYLLKNVLVKAYDYFGKAKLQFDLNRISKDSVSKDSELTNEYRVDSALINIQNALENVLTNMKRIENELAEYEKTVWDGGENEQEESE